MFEYSYWEYVWEWNFLWTLCWIVQIIEYRILFWNFRMKFFMDTMLSITVTQIIELSLYILLHFRWEYILELLSKIISNIMLYIIIVQIIELSLYTLLFILGKNIFEEYIVKFFKVVDTTLSITIVKIIKLLLLHILLHFRWYIWISSYFLLIYEYLYREWNWKLLSCGYWD